ncbi:MAG: ACP S-malonyltransferase [Gemmatimonadaceae bacterium]
MVLLFPGQGSQKSGMGKDLATAFPEARAVFEQADDALGRPLSALCFGGPEEELTSTENAQPALLAHGAAAWAVVRTRLAAHVRAAAGHSLGEFTAYHAAGALTLRDALRLVRRRGELMLESGRRRPGAMAAILGASESIVEAACSRATSESGTVVPANYNTPEQLVISGEIDAVERAMELCREGGAKRALRLNVSGAFHSPLMEVASAGLREALAATPMGPVAFPVYSNVTSLPARDVADTRRLLHRQLTSPVRWTDEVRQLVEARPDALFVEVGPGAVLSNLVRRIAPSVTTTTCGTPSDVESLLRRVA